MIEFNKYMIPAEESLIIPKKEFINIDKLREKYPLLVFTEDDSSRIFHYYKDIIEKLKIKYGFTGLAIMELVGYISNRLGFKNPLELRDYFVDKKLDAFISAEFAGRIFKNSNLFDDSNGAVSAVLEKCHEYSKKTNIMVVVYCTLNRVYSSPAGIDCPKLIVDKTILNGISETILKNKIHLNKFSGRPQYISINDNKNLVLYHVSTNENLTQLTPREPRFPLRSENVRVKRVSTSTDIEKCLNALDVAYGLIRTYYIYQLILTPNTRVVVPTPLTVPDVNRTNEHWVLDPVNVKKIGTIETKEGKFRINKI